MKTIITITLICLFPLIAFNQDSFTGFSFEPKVGLLFGSMAGGSISYGMDINLIDDNHMITIGAQKVTKANLILGPLSIKEHVEVNMMLGRFKDTKRFRLYYQLGLSALRGTKTTKKVILNTFSFSNPLNEPLFSTIESKEDFNTVGFVLQLGGQWLISKNGSLGIELQTNLNNENSYFIPTLTFSIGRLFAD